MSFIAVASRCSLHLLASRPLRSNVTSSIKLEVLNVAQRRRRGTEPHPQGICTQNCEEWSSSSRDMLADKQTHTDAQADGLITVLHRGTVTRPTRRTVLVLLGRVALVRGVAGYSHQTWNFPVNDLSVGRSVRPSVDPSVQCIVEKRWIGFGCRLAL